MKNHASTFISLLLLIAVTFFWAACSSRKTVTPPPKPDATGFLHDYHAMQDTVATQVGTIKAQAATLLPLTTGTPNAAPAIAAVAHVQAAADAIVAAIRDPKADPTKILAEFSKAIDEWSGIYAAQKKQIADDAKPSTRLLVELYGGAALCFTLIVLAAFARGWLVSIPLIGSWLSESIGAHVMVILGAIGGSLVVIAQAYVWAVKHPELFRLLSFAAVALGALVYGNIYHAGFFGKAWAWIWGKLGALWAWAKPEVARIEAKAEAMVGKAPFAAAPASAPATPAPASTAPATTFPASSSAPATSA